MIGEGMSEPVINALEDDCIEILLERNGVTVRKVVSSWHLLQPAINQLEWVLSDNEDG